MVGHLEASTLGTAAELLQPMRIAELAREAHRLAMGGIGNEGLHRAILCHEERMTGRHGLAMVGIHYRQIHHLASQSVKCHLLSASFAPMHYLPVAIVKHGCIQILAILDYRCIE